MTDAIPVEVAYALPDKQLVLKIQVVPGTTVGEAIAQSGIVEHFPELDIEHSKIGVFGEIVQAASQLQAYDRVEIYRPLQADPKEARRKRASRETTKKQGNRKPAPAVSVRTR